MIRLEVFICQNAERGCITIENIGGAPQTWANRGAICFDTSEKKISFQNLKQNDEKTFFCFVLTHLQNKSFFERYCVCCIGVDDRNDLTRGEVIKISQRFFFRFTIT